MVKMCFQLCYRIFWFLHDIILNVWEILLLDFLLYFVCEQLVNTFFRKCALKFENLSLMHFNFQVQQGFRCITIDATY